ncbi:hypothetical protein B0H12DRAFT_1029812, partial [Mycena haematopus]
YFRVDVSLFTIDSQSLFKINSLAMKAVTASSIVTFLGLLCNLWFFGRYYYLHRGSLWCAPLPSFLFRATKARDIYGSCAFFSLSARLPSLAVLISILALGTFVVCVVYQTLPTLTIVLGSIFFIVMGLQFIVRGSEVLYSSIADALSITAKWIRVLRDKARSVVVGTQSDITDLPINAAQTELNGRARQREYS